VGDLASFERYYLRILGRKESTATRHVERLRSWERLTGKPAAKIKPADVLEYLEFNPLGHAGNTRKGMVSSIQAFERFRAAREDRPANGLCEIGTPSIDDEDSPPPLELRHVRPLMGACVRPLEYRVVYGGLFLGLRIGESGYLHGSMWSDGAIWIRGEKKNRVRAIPVHPELERVIWEVFGHPPTDPATMQRVKRRLAKKTGISFRSHQLRKRFAQSLADAGVDKGTRADLLGHRTVDDLYASPSLRTLREAIALLHY
jgi:integrase